MHRPRMVKLCAAVGLTAATSCSKAAEPTRTGSASDAFVEVSRVTLDDSPIATIGQMRAFLPYGSQFLVADGMSDRVLLFAESGEFVKAIGRRGDGPGEFRTPLALLADTDSTILVSDLTARLTRLSPNLDLKAVYRVEVPLWVTQLTAVEGRILLTRLVDRTAIDNFVEWDPERGLGASFDPVNEVVIDVPYWNSSWMTLLTAGDDQLFAADNMVYPLRRYTSRGELIDTFGVAPPSWHQAYKPEWGEFATPEGQRKAQGWLRSFTLIDGIHSVGAEWLVITHREPVNRYSTDDVIRADVYRLGTLRKVWQDVRIPGPVVRGGSCAWVVVRQPPDPWTVGCWIPREPGRGLPN